jgi:hypothetical protein
MSTATTIAPEAAVTAATTLPGHPAPPATLTIFGAGGDLTKRLVVPALYNLVRAGKLPDDFAIIGVDHGGQTTEGWCQSLTEMMQALTRVGAREHQVEAVDQSRSSPGPSPHQAGSAYRSDSYLSGGSNLWLLGRLLNLFSQAVMDLQHAQHQRGSSTDESKVVTTQSRFVAEPRGSRDMGKYA